MTRVVLTGDRPTGRLHLGHYVGSLKQRLKIQEEKSFKQYVMVADQQALTDNYEDARKVAENVFEVVMDYIAIGLDPSRTTFFVQSQIPEISELTCYFLNLVSLSRLKRNPTVKTEIDQKGYGDSVSVGFLSYPVSQAADITILKAEIVPVGEDQLPMIEQTNEIVRRFNRIYSCDCLKEAQPLLGAVPRLIGIDGKAKASKSLGNAIMLSDEPQEIKRKVSAMYTDPNHLRVSDPGQVEGNVVFAYLDAFHSDKELVASLKAHYKRGGLGDSTLKEILNSVLQEFIGPIREVRTSLQHQLIREVIHAGIDQTRKVAAQTIAEVRDAMGLVY